MPERRPAPLIGIGMQATLPYIGLALAFGVVVMTACARPPAPEVAPVDGALVARTGAVTQTEAPLADPPHAGAVTDGTALTAPADASAAAAGASGAAEVVDPRGAPLQAWGTIAIAGRASSPKMRVELAQTEDERSRGLMFRRHLAPATGMLFFMLGDQPWNFWMKNTWISLDMIFIDAEWSVVGVLAAVPPNNLVSRGVARPSRYVLELAADEAARLGILPGVRLLFSRDRATPAGGAPR